MLNNRSPSLSGGIKFVGDNIYLITTALAIYISAQQHLSGKQKNTALATSDILNIVVVPFSALFSLWAAACRVYENIPQQFEGAWQLPHAGTDTPEGQEIKAFSIKQIKDTRNILLETAIVQTVLTTTLILAIVYSQHSLSGNSRFVIDTLFYILETADYGFNLKALESIEAISKSKLQPATLHPALRIMLNTNSATATRNNRQAFVPIVQPTRRMSVVEALRATLFQSASSRSSINMSEEKSNEDEKSAHSDVSSISTNAQPSELSARVDESSDEEDYYNDPECSESSDSDSNKNTYRRADGVGKNSRHRTPLYHLAYEAALAKRKSEPNTNNSNARFSTI